MFGFGRKKDDSTVKSTPASPVLSPQASSPPPPPTVPARPSIGNKPLPPPPASLKPLTDTTSPPPSHTSTTPNKSVNGTTPSKSPQPANSRTASQSDTPHLHLTPNDNTKSTTTSAATSRQPSMSGLPTPLIAADAVMPIESELNAQFELFMDSKLFKNDVKIKMRSLPAQHKWKLLCAESAQQSVSQTDTTAQPQHWCNALLKMLQNMNAIKPGELVQLDVIIRTSGKQWLESFIEDNGIVHLLDIASTACSTAGVNEAALRCIKSFMNNELGLQTVIDLSNGVDKLASILINGDNTQRTMIVDLLSVICWLSDTGHTAVMDSLSTARFGRRFKLFVDILRNHSSPTNELIELRTRVMTFVNTLINSIDAIQPRVNVRLELIDLGLLQVVEQLRVLVDSKRGPAYETVAQLNAQLDTFEQLMLSDVRDVTYTSIDTSDIDACYQYLKQYTQTSNNAASMLDTIHALMTIQYDDVQQSNTIWTNVKHIVQKATAINEDAAGEPSVVSYEQLKAIVEKQQSANSVDSATSGRFKELESTIEQQRQQLHELNIKHTSAEYLIKQQVDAAKAEAEKAQADMLIQIEQLKQQLQRARSAPVPQHATPAAPPAPASSAPVPPPMTGSAAPPAPPMAPATAPAAPPMAPFMSSAPAAPPMAPVIGGSAPPPPSAPPMAPSFGAPAAPPMAPSIGAPSVPPMAPPSAPMIGNGAPSPPPSAPGAPPMAPSAPGPPSAPGLPSAPMMSAPMAPAIPKKANNKPNVAMKLFHWSVVPATDITESTVWKQIDDTKVKLDLAELEQQFGTGAGKPKADDKAAVQQSSSADKTVKAKVEQVVLIDGKRSYAVNIALARFKMTHQAIRDALTALTLDEDKLSSLLTIAPNAEELESVMDYDGPAETLGSTELFFRTIGQISRVAVRVELSLFKCRFSTMVGEIKAQLQAMELAVRGIHQSTALKQLCQLVLSIGNYMNGGTAKGGAFGFKLDTLTKLKAMRGADGSTTLLTYIIHQSHKPAFKAIAPIVSELNGIAAAARIDLTQLTGDVGKMCGTVNRVKTELNAVPKTPTDQFHRVFEPFYEQSVSESTQCQTRLKLLNTQITECITYFGEDSGGMKVDGLLNTVNAFLNDWTSTVDAIEAKRVADERAAKSAADKAKRMSGKQQFNLKVPNPADNVKRDAVVESTLNTLSSASADELMKTIKARRQYTTMKVLPPPPTAGKKPGDSMKFSSNPLSPQNISA